MCIMDWNRGEDRNGWKDIFNINFIFIITGWFYLMVFVTCEPVCYTHASVDERNRLIKKVDCDGTDTIYWRFNSSGDVNMGDIINSQWLYSDDNPVTHEDNASEVITCSSNDLPTLTNGYFDCESNSTLPTGGTCSIRCNNGFYPPFINQAICEAGITNQGGVWSNGSFECLECNEWNQSGGSEYKYIKITQTWNESRKACESGDGHIVTIENTEENEFVKDIVMHCVGKRFGAAWIGLTDLHEEGTWLWSDGTVSAYRNWAEREPDVGELHDCAEISKSNGLWYDHLCTGIREVVCERNLWRIQRECRGCTCTP